MSYRVAEVWIQAVRQLYNAGRDLIEVHLLRYDVVQLSGDEEGERQRGRWERERATRMGMHGHFSCTQ